MTRDDASDYESRRLDRQGHVRAGDVHRECGDARVPGSDVCVRDGATR